eukprot:1925937-Pyramimonas_sp.AAC.1
MGGVPLQVFWFRSGVIQRRGLSGSLRALASAPMLQDLEGNLEEVGKGLGRACADEMGVVLFEFARVQIVFE